MTDLGAKLDFNCSRIIQSVFIYWKPPNTLDIPQLETDILYEVSVTYMGNTETWPEVNNSSITKTIPNMNSLTTNNCEKVFVSVTPRNTVGLGKSSSFTTIKINQGLIILNQE